MSKNEIANNAITEAILQEGQNAEGENTGSSRNHVILKINYEAEGIDAGLWVYGQQKNQGEIEFSGVPIGEVVTEKRVIEGVERSITLQKNAFVPLLVRQRYNLYDQKNPDRNCNSPLFKSNHETIYGTNYGYPCNTGCPYRDKDLGDKRCKMEFVLFGVVPAQNDEDDDVPVVMYVKGASYMNFLEWKKSANVGLFEINGVQKQKPVRMCTYYMTLGAIPKKNGATKYFQGYFEKGDMLTDIDAFKRYSAMADHLIEVLDGDNSHNVRQEQNVVPSKSIEAQQYENKVEEGDVYQGDVVDDTDTTVLPEADDRMEQLQKELEEIKSQYKKQQEV